MVNVPRWSSAVTKDEMAAGDGRQIIEFIQTHCRIDKDTVGGQRGELLELRPWQQLQIYRLFARRLDGRRKHRVGLLGLPRKNGKSALGSSIALAEADLGPHGGEIYCCAGDREQARIVYSTARQMVEMDPHLASRVKVYKNEMIWTSTETRLKVLSAEAYTKEGLNPTLVIFDEVHVQPNDELWDVMALAMGARVEPMMIGITTAGDPTDRFGNDSLAYRYYQHGKRVASGEVDDPSFYFAWWEPDTDDADHTEPETWRTANPGYGDLVLEEDFHSAVIRTHEAEFKTKRCNLWVVGSQAAVPSGAWERLTQSKPGRGRKLTFGSQIQVPADWLSDAVIFLDGSWSGDSTGIVASTRDGYLFPITHHEKQPTDGPDWRVPVTSVEDDIRLAIDNGARGLVADPHLWQRTLEVLRDDGYPVLEWPTNSLPRIVPAWKDFFNAMMDADGIAHNGDPALQRHIYNVTLQDPAGRARPVKQSRGRKIDLAICAIGAWVNRNVEFEPEKKRARMWSAVA